MKTLRSMVLGALGIFGAVNIQAYGYKPVGIHLMDSKSDGEFHVTVRPVSSSLNLGLLCDDEEGMVVTRDAPLQLALKNKVRISVRYSHEGHLAGRSFIHTLQHNSTNLLVLSPAIARDGKEVKILIVDVKEEETVPEAFPSFIAKLLSYLY